MDLINFLLPKIEHLHMAGYWLLLLVALFESLVAVGLILPGSTLVVFMGALAARGYWDLADLIWFATVGAILGDGISYLLGKRGKILFAENSRLFKQSYLEKGEEFFNKHGGKSVFLGRFFGPLRAVIPFIAGISRMSPRQFYFWNILSAVAWASSHLIAGYLLGNAWNMVEVWSGRVGLFLATVVLFLICIYLIERFMLTKGKQILDWCANSVKSRAQRITAIPTVRSFMEKHPGLVAKLGNRLDTGQFAGLPLTLMGIAFIYLLLAFFGVVEDVVNHESIVSFDTRFANLLHEYRSPALVKVFLWITLLGKAKFVLVTSLAATALFWIWNRKRYILPFWLTLGGSYLVIFLGKIVIHRQRPLEVGVYHEAFYSFPSGHAAIAAAVYGFIAYCVIRHVGTWRNRLNLSFVAIVLIASIGFSRLYLGVHFISDILGGYLLGSLWLIIGICLVEIPAGREQEHCSAFFSRRMLQSVTALIVLSLAAFYVHTGIRYQPIRNTANEVATPIVVDDIIRAFEDLRLPRYTESIMATEGNPLNVIIIAQDDASLTDAMKKAGWQVPDPVGFDSIGKIASSVFSGKSYLTAPIAPVFWNERANDLGFVRAALTSLPGLRREARFWTTRISTADGRAIYTGLVSLTDGSSWWAIPKNSPDSDAEGSGLFLDLRENGLIASYDVRVFVKPLSRKDSGNTKYFTDGLIYVIRLQ